MSQGKSNVRYFILFILFAVTTINYADRAILSIVGSAMQSDLGIQPVQMGILFSAFAWAYVLGQIPGGMLLDRFGTKKVYAASIFLWSSFTMLQSTVGWFSTTVAISVIFGLRFLVGLAESPSFPGNSRVAAAWFPASERGTAAGIFTSAQYFATVMFAPIMGWIVFHYSWHMVFVIMGCLGFLMGAIWLKTMHAPKAHPWVNAQELEHISAGGGDIEMGHATSRKTTGRNGWADLGMLLKNRMMLGVFIGQYCINTLSYFFLTWFPVYLVQDRGMSILKAGLVASVPAICGFLGGVLGGFISDKLIRTGHSLTFARKAPLVVGMIMSTTMAACNYVQTEWLIISIMALAYFGKGLGAIGWAVIADTAPREVAGLCGGVFNAFGNAAGITTPIVIGIILATTGSFEQALVFVSAHAVLAIALYVFLVGKIEKLDIKDGMQRRAVRANGASSATS